MKSVGNSAANAEAVIVPKRLSGMLSARPGDEEEYFLTLGMHNECPALVSGSVFLEHPISLFQEAAHVS